jgi:hypothetical protein
LESNVIHVEAQALDLHRGGRSNEQIALEAKGLLLDLGGTRADRRHVDGLLVQLEKTTQEGDNTVHELEGRLVAEVLGVVPADLGSNPPERPHAHKASREKLRELQAKRLRATFSQAVERRNQHARNAELRALRRRAEPGARK